MSEIAVRNGEANRPAAHAWMNVAVLALSTVRETTVKKLCIRSFAGLETYDSA